MTDHPAFGLGCCVCYGGSDFNGLTSRIIKSFFPYLLHPHTIYYLLEKQHVVHIDRLPYGNNALRLVLRSSSGG
ncbi:hypothetical protein J6590_061684 [Homalodisca vitripennis]|nr:hypothetical protein J6590_061684 [Homalodisca vitripennis]